MSKCLKIICCYFGDRRNVHNTPTNILDFIKINVENEINIENEIDTDVILVNNNSGNIEANEFLNSYDGVKTKNGKIIVETRENRGGSFGAYYYSFLKYKDEYDYWFFCEDDVLIYEDGYMKEFVNYLNTSPELGFVSLAPISSNPFPTHSGGGCGLTSTEKFINSRGINYITNTLNSFSPNPSYHELEANEVSFTNLYYSKTYHISNHPNFSPLCSNFNLHGGQKGYYTPEQDNLKFIYKVGF
jgi:hypothetical protein